MHESRFSHVSVFVRAGYALYTTKIVSLQSSQVFSACTSNHHFSSSMLQQAGQHHTEC